MSLSADQIQAGSWVGVALLAYAGGLLTAFTPCVYPLIPVTLGVMGVRGGTSWFKSLTISLTFVLGLALVYSLLGFSAAWTGKILGSITQQPWMIVAVGVLFAGMGMSLLGLFTIQFPPRIQTWLSRHGGTGFGGTLALGAVSGLLAAPCAGPVIVGILGFVAQKSNPGLGWFLLFLYSLGLGTPFVVLALTAQHFVRIPMAGLWTEWVKHFCGLALLVGAVWYIRPALPYWAFVLVVALGVAAGAAFVHRLFPTSDGRHHPLHHWTRIAAGLALFLFIGIPRNEPVVSPNGTASLTWMNSEPEALRTAMSSGKPVMIDFWAEWCEACKELESVTYADARVKSALEKSYILLKVDATDTSKVESVLRKYDVTGLPTVLFLQPSGNVLTDLTLTGFLPVNDFLDLLDRASVRFKKPV